MTKIDQVKKRLLKGKPITQKLAIEKYNYYRLSSGINRLRNRGMNIKTTMRKSGDSSYAEYRLVLIDYGRNNLQWVF
jgi:hypothetical protein